MGNGFLGSVGGKLQTDGQATIVEGCHEELKVLPTLSAEISELIVLKISAKGGGEITVELVFVTRRTGEGIAVTGIGGGGGVGFLHTGAKVVTGMHWDVVVTTLCQRGMDGI